MARVRKTGRPLTPGEEARYADIRRKVEEEFPPKHLTKSSTQDDSIGGKLRAAREAQRLTWYAVAKAAGIPNSGTIRDIEAGRDAKLSNIEAVAAALGLRLELSEAR